MKLGLQLRPFTDVIIGANAGIGYATAKVIASAAPKYQVIMTGRSLPKVEAAAAEIAKTPGLQGKVSNFQLEVTDETSIEKAANQVAKDHGRLDVLINNAGIFSKAASIKDQVAETMAANVAGVAMVTAAFTDLLLKSSNPYLIQVSSGVGSLGKATDKNDPFYTVGGAVYRASKSALNMLVTQDARILGEKGIKVFPMCPGLVESNLRGTKAEEVSAGGYAGDPAVSGQTILSIIEGKRDADVGKFVHKDGVYAW